MNGFKALSACAVLALVLAMAAPAASLAELDRGKARQRRRGPCQKRLPWWQSLNHVGTRGFAGGAPAARFSGDDAGYRGTLISGSVVGAMGFYDNGYYEDGAGPVVQNPGGDAVAYCMQTYKSYDPRSGTYLGDDGRRHPCL